MKSPWQNWGGGGASAAGHKPAGQCVSTCEGLHTTGLHCVGGHKWTPIPGAGGRGEKGRGAGRRACLPGKLAEPRQASTAAKYRRAGQGRSSLPGTVGSSMRHVTPTSCDGGRAVQTELAAELAAHAAAGHMGSAAFLGVRQHPGRHHGAAGVLQAGACPHVCARSRAERRGVAWRGVGVSRGGQSRHSAPRRGCTDSQSGPEHPCHSPPAVPHPLYSPS